MNIILAISGVSGSGKSSLLRILQKTEKSVSIHRKDTTRQRRNTEAGRCSHELKFIDEADFHQRNKEGLYEAVYLKYDNYYGILGEQIVEAFRQKQFHCIIVRDMIAIRTLKQKFPNVKAVYCHADPRDVRSRLKNRNRREVSQRLKKNRDEYQEFIDFSGLFDHIVVNFHEIGNAVRQFQNIIELYETRT